MFKIKAAKPYDEHNKHRNEEDAAVQAFLRSGGPVQTLLDSKSAKSMETRARKDEKSGARFIFSKAERFSR